MGDPSLVGLPTTCSLQLRRWNDNRYLSISHIDSAADKKRAVLRDERPGHPCWETWEATFHTVDVASHRDRASSPVAFRVRLRDLSGHYLTPSGGFSTTPVGLEFEVDLSGHGELDVAHRWRLSPTRLAGPDQTDGGDGTPLLRPPGGWRLELALPPAVSARALSPWPVDALRHLTPGAALDTGSLRSLMRVTHRAHREIGFFHLVDLGDYAVRVMRLFDGSRQAFGNLERRDVFADDQEAKISRELESRRGYDAVHDRDAECVMSGTSVLWTDVCSSGVELESLLQSDILEAFNALRDLGEKLLYVLALAQWVSQGVAPAWRCQFSTESPYFSLRLLQYYPGKQRGEEGHSQMTTSPHTDATWLTLLMEDECGGLSCRKSSGQAWTAVSPVRGGLVANTGNVLEKESGGYYRAVCHCVRRTEATEERTRFSMPFFMDKEGGQTGGC